MLKKISANQAFWPGAVAPIKPKNASSRISKPKRTASGRFVHHTDLLSRTLPDMSDEEFMDAAREQAQMDFAKGVYQGPEFGALQNSFVSVVSPDRASLARNAFNHSPPAQPQPQPQPHQTPQYHPYPARYPAPVQSQPQFAAESFVYDTSGRPIAHYVHGHGWTEIYTPEENARRQMILQTYNDTWMTLHRQAQAENNRFEQRQSDLGIGAYDAKG